MPIRTLLAASIIGLSSIALSAYAQNKETKEEHRADYEKAFGSADKNKDGGLSRDEIKAAGSKRFENIRQYFDQMDGNKDGKVTLAERDAWLKAHPNAKLPDEGQSSKKK